MDPILIDTRHRGRERAIGCWDLGGALVDPGPESCLETVLEGVSERPQALLLTHIHLDHAGATGALVRRWPDIEVYVHERGAPHLIDPSKLIASAGRLYGDEMQELWGEIVPVPERNVRVLEGGETVTAAGREFSVTYTPGHASHHVVYFEPATAIAYVGDVAGVRIPPSSFVGAPTPPPDIDIEAWRRSLDAVRALQPQRIALTHFGMADDAAAQLDGVSEALTLQSEVAHELLDAGLEPEQAAVEFSNRIEQRILAASDAETAAAAIQVSHPMQNWLGLKRYWEKVAAA